jgi:glycosyltransferase involved in cell wall biosynthesis
MKLGVIYTTEVHNSMYRAVWPAEAFQRRGGHQIELVKYSGDGPIQASRLRDCDVVHVYRRADRTVIKCVDALLAQGIAITYDNDDDVRLAPKESESYKEFGGAKGQRDFRTQAHLMSRVHVVTTTTDTLAERFGADCTCPIEVIPNFLDDAQFVKGPRNSEGVVIGWVAGREHVADAKRLRITQMLQRVIERRPEVRVVTMGVRLDLDASRYTFHSYIPLHRLGAETRKFDIGIAPLADIPMSYARSDVKVKEYSAAGVPWVASARGSYALLSPRFGGLVVDDDGWEDALVSLVASKFKRAQLRRCAEKWARSQRIDRNIKRWESVWAMAAQTAARQASASGPSSRAVVAG